LTRRLNPPVFHPAGSVLLYTLSLSIPSPFSTPSTSLQAAENLVPIVCFVVARAPIPDLASSTSSDLGNGTSPSSA
jgi:hypothetical protein